MDERQERAASILGVEPDVIRRTTVELDTLRQQGILIDLTVMGTSMFTRAATWMELGINEDDMRRERLTRGQKYLIPEEQVLRLRSVESQLRQMFERYTFKVPGFYPYRWLPFTAYEVFKTEFVRLAEKIVEIREEILTHYDEYVDLLVADFSRVAEQAWRSIQSEGEAVVVIDGRSYYDLYAFTDEIVSRAITKMPSRSQISGGLKADYIPSLAYSSEEIEVERERADLEREKARSESHQLYLERHEAERQVQHADSIRRLEIEERHIKIEAMRQAEAEHARQVIKEMGSPFEAVFSALRQQMAEDAASMLESIRKNGFVRGKIAQKGAGLLEFYQIMAAHDDHELRGRLAELRTAIGPVGEGRGDHERDTQEIVGILEGIKDLFHNASEDLQRGPSRFSLVEL